MEDKKILDNEMENVSGGAANGPVYYRIVSGDTLGDIANRFGTTIGRLMDLNPKIKNPNLIYAGDTIRIW